MGSPLDRPTYQFANPTGLTGIFKKGINPKAKAILEDILGKTAADEYHKEQDMLDKEQEKIKQNNEEKEKSEND